MATVQLVLIFFLGLVLYLDIVAWLALRADPTLSTGRKLIQGIVAFLLPLVGAYAVLLLCERALPGSTARYAIPWPFRGLIEDAPAKPNPLAESFEDFKRRLWNL